MIEQVALPRHPRLRATPNYLELHRVPALAQALVVLEEALSVTEILAIPF